MELPTTSRLPSRYCETLRPGWPGGRAISGVGLFAAATGEAAVVAEAVVPLDRDLRRGVEAVGASVVLLTSTLLGLLLLRRRCATASFKAWTNPAKVEPPGDCAGLKEFRRDCGESTSLLGERRKEERRDCAKTSDSLEAGQMEVRRG